MQSKRNKNKTNWLLVVSNKQQGASMKYVLRKAFKKKLPKKTKMSNKLLKTEGIQRVRRKNGYK